MADVTSRAALPIIRHALAEDRARQDVTSAAVIPATRRIKAHIIAKSPGVAAGIKMAMLTFTTVDRSLRCRQYVHSGTKLSPGKALLSVEGRARSIFAAERVALNLLAHLSGIATLTHAFVQQTRSTRAKIFDTRKTIPGLRALEKYAVRAGGGHNHRSDLADAILIKTNHLRAHSTKHTAHRERLIPLLIATAKRVRPKRFVEIEVTNLREFQVALHARPDAILLDNMSLKEIRAAVRFRLRSPVSGLRSVLLEVSGGVTLTNVRAIAKTGVDRISIGRLTHSAPSLDVSLQVISY